MKPFSGTEKTRIVLVEHSHNFLICLKIFTFPSVLLLTGSRLLEFEQKKKFLKIYCSISVNINCFEQLLHFGLNTLWLKLSSNCKERKALNFSILLTVRTDENFENYVFTKFLNWHGPGFPSRTLLVWTDSKSGVLNAQTQTEGRFSSPRTVPIHSRWFGIWLFSGTFLSNYNQSQQSRRLSSNQT